MMQTYLVVDKADAQFIIILLGIVIFGFGYFLMKQAKMTGKQALFGRRMDNYLLFNELFEIVGKNAHLMADENRAGFNKTSRYALSHFVEGTYWRECSSVFGKHGQKCVAEEFGDRLRELQNLAFEAEFLFADRRISEYYKNYVGFLKAAYMYAVTLSMEDDGGNYEHNLFTAFDKLMGVHNDIKDKMLMVDELKVVQVK